MPPNTDDTHDRKMTFPKAGLKFVCEVPWTIYDSCVFVYFVAVYALRNILYYRQLNSNGNCHTVQQMPPPRIK